VIIKTIDVLPKLFQDVYAPPSVMAELTHAKTPDLEHFPFYNSVCVAAICGTG